jgi:tetratricopeptide (TPR) repeat protein
MARQSAPVEVFCSYAHEDEMWLRKLETHLEPLKRQGVISLWHDRLIAAGTDWRQSIDIHLETAAVILLLVSADFLASDYCYGVEMRRALQRQATHKTRIVPVLVRPVDWQGTPFAHLPALPVDARPISTWSDSDAALADVAGGLRRMLIADLPFSPVERSCGPVMPLWNVAHLRNPNFTGREELLGRIHQQFVPAHDNDWQTHGQALAIRGIGGIGKTQIVVEYAYRARDLGCYAHILWVNAASEETLLASVQELAQILPSLSVPAESDQRTLVEAIKRWLEQCPQRWLLIFDNADELSLVRNLFPQGGKGCLLLTTRAGAVGALAKPIEVENMGLIEGQTLLLRRAQRLEQASEEEQNEAVNLVIALDAFPLALDQAGAYIEETRCSLADYLQMYQTCRKDLLARRGCQATEYPAAVATTWSLSFQKVEQANPAAADLLRLCAFLAPDLIPEDLLRGGASCWPSLLQQAVTALSTFNQLLAELLKFSLVKREERALSVHRLVQAVHRDGMEVAVQRQWAERVLRAVHQAFPEDPLDVAAWPRCLLYLEQVRACDELISQYTLFCGEAADLLARAGVYLQRYAFDSMVEPLYQRALAIREQCLGADHRDTVRSLSDLAGLYLAQGRYAESETLYLRVVSARAIEAGPELAATLNSLALLCLRRGQPAVAERWCRQAQGIYEGGAGRVPPALLSTLAQVYHDQGDYARAQELYLRILASERGASEGGTS